MYSLMVFMYKFYKHAIHPCLVRNLEVVQAILSRKVFNVNNCFQVCWSGWTIGNSTQTSGGCLCPWTDVKNAQVPLTRQKPCPRPWAQGPRVLLLPQLKAPSACRAGTERRTASFSLLPYNLQMQKQGVGQMAWKLPVPQVKQRAGKDGTGLTYLQEGFPPKSWQWSEPAFCCCCCSVTQPCLILCNPMDCSTPGFPVLHYLHEFAQTHAHWVGDAMLPSQPLTSPLLLLSIFPSIRDFCNKQLFTSGSPSIGASASATLLPVNIQGWFPLGLTDLSSLIPTQVMIVIRVNFITVYVFNFKS